MMKTLCRFMIIMLPLCSFNVNAYDGGDDGGFMIAPYLLEIDKVSATVAFCLKQDMEATVYVYDNDQILEFKSERPFRKHFIRVKGLEPGRTYNYRVVCGDGRIRTLPGDTSYQIRTACKKGESFSFVVFGDPRPGENLTNKHHLRVIERIIPNEPAFLLVLGDMVDDGTELGLWRGFFAADAGLLRKAAIYPVMGDNDYVQGKGLVKGFFPMLEKGYYGFEWGDVRFFGLNAWDSRGFQSRSELDADSEQVKWLKAQLSKDQVQESLFRVVFMHDPVMISRGYSSGILKRVWEPVFRKYNVDVVFASWHLYERSQYNGVRYIISGGGGAELLWLNKNPDYTSQAEARQYHFCRIDISAGTMTISAIDVNDTILDSITMTPRKYKTDNSPDLNKIAEKLREEIYIQEGNDQDFLPVHLFSYGCAYCHKVLKDILPRLARRYQVSLKVYYYDLELHENVYDLLLSAGADFGYQYSEIPAIFLGDKVFGGEGEIEDGLKKELCAFKKDPSGYIHDSIVPFQDLRDTKDIKEDAFDKLSVKTVLDAGLADGLNTCILTALMSLGVILLLTAGSLRSLVISGMAFIVSMFMTYMMIGLMFFKIALIISEYSIVSDIVKWILLACVLSLAAVRIVHYTKGLKSGTDKMDERLSRLLESKYIVATAGVVLGIVAAGTAVACIGQVYMAIITMIMEPIYRIEAVWYLFLHDLAFILPVLTIYSMVAAGITLRRRNAQGK